MGKLTPEEVASYREEGYALYHKPLFSDEQFARLTALFEQQLAEKGAKLSDELDTPHYLRHRAAGLVLCRY